MGGQGTERRRERDGETQAERRHTDRHVGSEPGRSSVFPAQQERLLYGEEVKPIKLPQIFEMAQTTSQGRRLASSYGALRRKLTRI